MSYVQDTYNLLRGYGLSEAGALGLIGNWVCESGCEPNRLQGDFSPYRSASKTYVTQLETFAKDRNTFARDGMGFGLAQWTYYTRKEELYDEWRASSLAIDSVDLQVRFAVKELKRDYPKLWQFLGCTDDIYLACSQVCREYERPAYNNIDARYNAAVKARSELDLTGESQPATPPESPSSSSTSSSQQQAEIFWPPRTIDKNMDGKDVAVLQAVLAARGYSTQVTGIFDSYLEERVKTFQRAQGLTADGVVGPLTWAKLLAR